MKHIQDKFEGSSLQAWEIDHGIVRVVRGGCEYVILADRAKFDAANERERMRHARSSMMRAAEDDFPTDIF